MTEKEPSKPTLHLTGPREGGPSFDDLMDRYRQLTGNELTPAELAAGQAIYATIEQA